MFKYINLIAIIFVALVLFSCEDRKDLTAPEPQKPVQGSVDFTRFVALGNSITAGLESGSLYESAQMYSFPAQIARTVNAEFVMPLISEPGLPANRIEVVRLYPSPVFYYNPNTGVPKNLTYGKPYNNLAIPGSFVFDLLNAKDSTTCFSYINGKVSNPLFNLILRGQGTMFQQTKAMQPTFITLWTGNNDILGYATSGGTVPFTPVANFQFLYNQLLDSIATLGAKVAVANLIDISTIPFFTTVGGQLFLGGTKVLWGVSATGDTIPMSTLTNYFTLKAQALLTKPDGTPSGMGASRSNPLPNSVILDSMEILTTKDIVNQYNTIINNAVTAKGYALVDAFNVFKKLMFSSTNAGAQYNGVTFNNKFIEGNFFSLDGVHPTARGQAVIAVEFVKAINQKYGSNIPLVNVSLVPGSLIFR